MASLLLLLLYSRRCSAPSHKGSIDVEEAPPQEANMADVDEVERQQRADTRRSAEPVTNLSKRAPPGM